VGFRLPGNIGQVGQLSAWGDGPYPPPSLAVFDDHALGNGDNYGLYWPIGFEAHEPLVMETVHDAWGLLPAFSSLDRFIALTSTLDEGDHAGWPTLAEDPRSPHALYQAARAALKVQDFETAFSHLLTAVETLPEYTAALSLLSTLYLRRGSHDDACRISVRAVRSPPSFGMGADLAKTWSWLSRQSHGPDDILADPIWLRRASLKAPPAGGAKENDVYPMLLGAIDGYIEADDVVDAVTLMQTYAELMWRETVSFRERHGFSRADHRQRQLRLEALLPSGPRAVL
jgi:hypothetical protein